LQLSAESRRAAALENVSGMVLENIGTGVMMFSSNLLVERANPAARKILGYASPLKMNVSEVFRGLQTVELPSPNGASGGITQAIRDVFTNGAEYREVPARYSTPSGDSYHLRLALLPIRESGQQVTATLCLLGTADAAFTLSLPAAEAGRNKSEAE
jgi:PAS domain-containing protein